MELDETSEQIPGTGIFFFFFFVLLGSYQACHALLLLLVQCSSSVKLQWNILDGMKEQF